MTRERFEQILFAHVSDEVVQDMLNQYVLELEAENAKLREYVERKQHLQDFARLVNENAKLRELVRILKNCADECGDCDTCPINGGSGVLNPWLGCDSLCDRMRGLGIEVPS